MLDRYIRGLAFVLTDYINYLKNPNQEQLEIDIVHYHVKDCLKETEEKTGKSPER